MSSARHCTECGKDYDPEKSFYQDVCDECAAEQEGVGNINELYEP